jgi:ribonuclease HI
MMVKPTVIFDMQLDTSKSCTSSDLYLNKFKEIRHRYHTYNSIYTDGSKDTDKVAAAAVTRSSTLQCRLPDRASIFTAEIQAILLALDHIAKSSDNHFIIFSDSKSCLQAIANLKLEHPLILQTLEKLNSRKLIGKYVIFCWLPSHTGIKGNEEADAAAKAALQRPVSNIRIPHSDFKPYITNLMTDIWQNNWNKKVNNKLFEIKPTLGRTCTPSMLTRRDEVVLCRARIGHTHLTHSYLLKGEDQPECIPCQCALTIKHILIDCVDFSVIRQNHFNVKSLKELFDTIDTRVLLKYLKEIGLYYKF